MIILLGVLTLHQLLDLSLVAIVILLVWITSRSVSHWWIMLQSRVQLYLREIGAAVRWALRNTLNL